MNRPNPLSPDRMSARERLAEVCELLAFGRDVPQGACATVNLSESGNLEEAAAKLFAALRKLDQACAETIAVMPIPAEGLGEAINDRLQRAANRG